MSKTKSKKTSDDRLNLSIYGKKHVGRFEKITTVKDISNAGLVNELIKKELDLMGLEDVEDELQ